MSTEIQRVKNQVALENLVAEAEACQASGSTVTEGCNAGSDFVGKKFEIEYADGNKKTATVEETLAIAIYCSLKYSNEFEKAIIASVNHSGDSDSTGAATGNILGAYLGLKGVPQKYLDNLELKDVILEMADDLYNDCKMSEYDSYYNEKWDQKYMSKTYKTVTKNSFISSLKQRLEFR